MSERRTCAYDACIAACTCRACRDCRDVCVAPCCPTRATQHITTFSCAKMHVLDSVSHRVVTWRTKWNLGLSQHQEFNWWLLRYTYSFDHKIWHNFVCLITSSNIDQFSNFYCQNQEKICNNINNIITKDPTASQVCHNTDLWNVSVLVSNNWKQDDFCNNTLYECVVQQQCGHIEHWM